MKPNTWKTTLLFVILASACMIGKRAQAEIATDHIFLLSPNHKEATFDYYSYSPSSSVHEITYFLVLFGGIQASIETLSVKLSTSPVFKAYTGSVTYRLFAVGYPNIFCAKQVTATNATVASNYIKADFTVNAQFGFALIGAALTERHDVISDVKMSLKVSVQ